MSNWQDILRFAVEIIVMNMNRSIFKMLHSLVGQDYMNYILTHKMQKWKKWFRGGLANCDNRDSKERENGVLGRRWDDVSQNQNILLSVSYQLNKLCDVRYHDDVMARTRFLHYWLFRNLPASNGFIPLTKRPVMSV